MADNIKEKSAEIKDGLKQKIDELDDISQIDSIDAGIQDTYLGAGFETVRDPANKVIDGINTIVHKLQEPNKDELDSLDDFNNYMNDNLGSKIKDALEQAAREQRHEIPPFADSKAGKAFAEQSGPKLNQGLDR